VKAQVYVTLKKDVLDPQGRAVASSLRALGFDEVTGVRIGKVVELELSGDAAEVDAHLENMCQKLLANTVIEDYRYVIEDEA